MIRLAPEGVPFVLGALAVTVVLFALAPLGVAVLWLPIALWVIAFFRDPVRDGPRGEDLVIAPADGLVVSVMNVDEPDYVQARTTRVSIFMNVFNVHVNRYPVGGTIEYRHYHKGVFGHAAAEKASRENEQSAVGMASARGRVLVRQIAGLIARRIVTDHEVGTAVTQGERMGIIRFGSRVDVFVPATAKVLVHVGDRTVAGVTVVARWD
jgi:phosphatidylserine decarboxylase